MAMRTLLIVIFAAKLVGGCSLLLDFDRSQIQETGTGGKTSNEAANDAQNIVAGKTSDQLLTNVVATLNGVDPRDETGKKPFDSGFTQTLIQTMGGSTTSSAMAAAAGPTIIDNFNRADSPGALGTSQFAPGFPTWMDNTVAGGTVDLMGGRAILGAPVIFDEAASTLTVGNMATFDIQATYNLTAGANGWLVANGTAPAVDGIGMLYTGGGTSFTLFATPNSTSPAFPAFAVGTDMTWRLQYDAPTTTLTGTITQGMTTVTHSAVRPNDVGTDIIIYNDGGSAGTVTVDNLQKNP